eukprot:2750993-Pyramimonas_sp.AAC.1
MAPPRKGPPRRKKGPDNPPEHLHRRHQRTALRSPTKAMTEPTGTVPPPCPAPHRWGRPTH